MTDMLLTGIVQDPRYLDHRPEEGHPDSPQRLESVYGALSQWPHGHRLAMLRPRPATREELLWVHSRDLLGRLETTVDDSGQMLSADTQASEGSYLAARLAAGGLFVAIDKVVAGELSNAFALVRPPGHHAERNRAMGYCLLNNVALGAMYARRTLGLERVLIVDWDVHHGNGTQHAFDSDPSVLFFSMHQYPHFPGTGHFTETGIGRGEGYSVNIAMPKGHGDGEYSVLMETLLGPVAEQFAPDLILVSAGFDTHGSDPMGNMRMTAPGFAGLTRILMDRAQALCRGRLVLCLEGGYHLQALAESVLAVLSELSGITHSDPASARGQADPRKVDYVRKRAVSVHNRFWKGL
ncbi:MAG: histone deacetylase [Desulfobacterales bacterium]|nr:histone deacetylase [Desulfobacterales bacterium]